MGASERETHGVAVEPSRISTRMAVGLGVVLAVLSVAAMLLVAGLFGIFERGAERRDTAAADAAGLQTRENPPPPQPRLEVYGARHWQEFRSAEEKQLTTYGWMNRSAGVVRIPIERAMERIAERGVGPLSTAPSTTPEARPPEAGKGAPRP
jgi:hypothetical protein